jgi:hypothetical protein
VNLALDSLGVENENDVEPIKHAQDRVLKKLRPTMSDEDYQSIRRYQFLPLISLTVDGETLLYLLAMPEIKSIELDREIDILD